MNSIRAVLRNILIVIGAALLSLLCALFLLFYVVALLSDFALELDWLVARRITISIGVSAGYLFFPGFWMLLAGRWLPSARLRRVGRVLLLAIVPVALLIAALDIYAMNQ